uniref:Uncharacterized protein n=1 Tax=Panagrolaimus sp. ES5 TaxID=591445 RepID=A0AC34GRL4_9BILA
MGLAYWATYPMAESCSIWSKKLTEMENKRKLERNKLMECDLEYLSAFFYYGTFTSLSAIGWFTRMTLDPIIDLV